jgi:UDPglucose 6-dehydrogenase
MIGLMSAGSRGVHPKVSVIGLGRLGGPIAGVFASRGFETWGYDPAPEAVDAVRERRALTYEPGVEALYARTGERLHATSDLAEAVLATDVSFLVVPTPTRPDGSFSLEHVLATTREVGAVLAGKDGYHLVVLTSTVMPGATDGLVRSALEEASGKLVGVGLGLCYSAVFVAMGTVIENFLRPSMTLVGECDEASGRMLEEVYRVVCENDPPIARMSPFNAELTKLAMNVLVATKISIANLLARICELMPGGDVDVVTQAMQLDPRVGRGALRGAIAYGGPFFGRDNHAFGTLMRRLEVARDLEGALGRFNRAQVPWLADFVEARLVDGGCVGVLGLSYKPDTDVVESSPSLYLCRRLSEHDIPVTAHDPAAMEAARRMLPPAVGFANTAEICIRRADLVVVTTPWDAYREVPVEAWARADEPRTVVDCWRFLPHLAEQPGITYVALGKGPGTRTAT